VCGVEPKDCDDGDPCTLDTCELATGECGHKPVVCTSSDPCFASSCNSDLGVCEQAMVCNDNNPCTIDKCDNTKPNPTDPTKPLCSQKTIQCDDFNPCTIDSCDPVSGNCVFKQITPADCDDGQFCTNDFCDIAAGGCVHTTNLCNDSDDCTVDFCIAGACEHALNSSNPNCPQDIPCSTSADCVPGRPLQDRRLQAVDRQPRPERLRVRGGEV
jgi:hypothetical protein